MIFPRTGIRSRAALILGAALLLLSGCTATPEAAPPPSPASGYPVTIEHRLGSTTISAPPKRIVALGQLDLDVLLALGITPAGIPRTADHPSGITPWAREKLGGTAPPLLTIGDNGFDPEQVLKLQPDLILANHDRHLDKYHAKLNAFVPTTAFERGPQQDGWQQVTRQIGTAVGKAAEAEKLISDTEAALTKARADRPSWQGKRATLAQYGAGKLYALRAPEDPAGALLGSLGLRIPESLQALPGSFVAGLNPEQYDRLDVDLLVLNYDGAAANEREIESRAQFRDLRVVRAGGRIALDGLEFNALRTPSPGNIPWLISTVLPRFAKALG